MKFIRNLLIVLLVLLPITAEAQVVSPDSDTNNVTIVSPWATQNMNNTPDLGPFGGGGYDLIGTAGEQGFGVGVASTLPVGMTALDGTTDVTSDNYGNYQFSDGSIMVYIPRFYYKVGTGSNGLDVNVIDIKGADTYATTALANASGYALHRAFIDGGSEKDGFFFDKYENSKNAKGTGFVASSIKNGLPISTHADHNPIADLTAVASNNYYQAINAAHARDGVDGAVNPNSIFHVGSMYQYSALAMLATAHGQASSDTTYNAWYDTTYNFPKGCNNNALGGANDGTVSFTSDGYSNACKAGSGVPFERTTHNGAASGVADLNGGLWELGLGQTAIMSTSAIEGMTQANPCVVTVTGHGLTTGNYAQINSISQADWDAAKDKMWQVTVLSADTFSINFDASAIAVAYDAGTDPGSIYSGSFYAAKEATSMADFSDGNSGATDHWGATGVAAMMDAIDLNFVDGGGFAQRYGNSSNQVLAEDVTGADWVRTGLGMPAQGGVSTSGTNLYGTDYYYEYMRNELFPVVGGTWGSHSNAGVWSRSLSHYRTLSYGTVGFRSACYPD